MNDNIANAYKLISEYCHETCTRYGLRECMEHCDFSETCPMNNAERLQYLPMDWEKVYVERCKEVSE